MAKTLTSLRELLPPEHVVVPLQAETVRDAVRALIELLVDTGAVTHPERLDSFTSAERMREVIHVGSQVLLPHLRTDAAERLTVALGIAPKPLRGATGEEEPQESARVVVLVLAPPEVSNRYLQLIAALARALRGEAVVARLLNAETREEVLAIPEIRDLKLEPRLTVRDVMTHRVLRVYPDTPVSELLELVTRHALRAVPVVGPKREVLGMVTERDLLRFLQPRIQRAGGAQAGEAPPEQSASGSLVRDIMSRSVMCISEDQSLADVTSIMLNKDVERFPVVSEGKLTGFLTRGDILRKLFGS